ncbi:MAG TPA: hypothetical protein VM869_10345 [Enhygromyxa sp.]|nr:hypothetical protein [Enhygromyxa sp.]
MNNDFLDLLIELSAANARFMVVGGYAVGVHGHPRATKDLDIWVEPTLDNATRVIAALAAFRAPIGDLTAEDLATPGIGFMMGVPPSRIDILTAIAGLEFGTAWSRRVTRKFGPVECPVLSLEDLIENKRAAGRPQDLADADELERIRSLSET